MKTIKFVSWGRVDSQKQVETAIKIGIDTHRLPIGWSDVEVKENEFTFTDILPQVKWVLTSGMNLIINFSSHYVPKWFGIKYPEAKLKNSSGEVKECLGFPDGDGVSYWFPLTHQYIRRFMRKTVECLKQEGLLEKIAGVEICIQFEGQLCYPMDGKIWAFDDFAISSYRSYLSGRYKEDISKLNKDWNTNYRTFLDVLPPKKYEDSPECLVFRDFYRNNLLNAAISLGDAIEDKLPEDIIWYYMSHQIDLPDCEPNAAGRYPLFYMKELKKLGRATHVVTAVVPRWNPRPFVRELKRLGLTVIGEWWNEPTPAQQREQAHLSKKYSCDGLFVGVLKHLCRKDGRLTIVGKETAVIIREWKEKTLSESPYSNGCEGL